MKRLFALGAAAVFAVAAQAAAAAPVPAVELAELQLRALNHRFVTAFLHGDAAFMASLVDDDFRMIGLDGARVDRAGLLAATARPSGLEAVSYDELRVRQFGPVALLQGVFEGLDAGQRPLRLRYTDVFHWDGSRWRLVAAQNTPLREGVGKAAQRGSAPAHAGWSGVDPAGDELEVLRQLNEQYVKAYREADVAWYDAHLAPDYVVVNGDGSVSDRASALADFAKSSFATHFRSFPVDQVNIRRFGELALTEAENAFELKDGRRGVSRYTDIWQRQDGRWRCVSAHITAFRRP